VLGGRLGRGGPGGETKAGGRGRYRHADEHQVDTTHLRSHSLSVVVSFGTNGRLLFAT
jgi:hypothetical protein